jgi:hypothetical protein
MDGKESITSEYLAGGCLMDGMEAVPSEYLVGILLVV